jgi:hypothetical protein
MLLPRLLRATARSSSSSILWQSPVVCFSTIPAPPSSNHRHTPLPNAKGSIIYTETDEAPALATYSLYPVLSKVGSTSLVIVVDVVLVGSPHKKHPALLDALCHSTLSSFPL